MGGKYYFGHLEIEILFKIQKDCPAIPENMKNAVSTF